MCKVHFKINWPLFSSLSALLISKSRFGIIFLTATKYKILPTAMSTLRLKLYCMALVNNKCALWTFKQKLQPEENECVVEFLLFLSKVLRNTGCKTPDIGVILFTENLFITLSQLQYLAINTIFKEF